MCAPRLPPQGWSRGGSRDWRRRFHACCAQSPVDHRPDLLDRLCSVNVFAIDEEIRRALHSERVSLADRGLYRALILLLQAGIQFCRIQSEDLGLFPRNLVEGGVALFQIAILTRNILAMGMK